MHLANPAAIQQYSGLKYTDDHSDARWLAHLLRLGVFQKGISTPRPNGRCEICYANARIWSVSTPPMSSVCKISGAEYRGTFQRQTDSSVDKAGTPDLAG